MKKMTICFSTLVSLFLFSAAIMAADKVELNDALKKGLISITIIGKANGEIAELRLKRLTSTPVIITINNGRTDIAGEVSVLSKGDAEVDLSSKYEEVISLKQTGADRITRGPVTVDADSVK